MDKPDKKNSPSPTDTKQTQKASSVLDDILGGGFGSDDLGLGLDLDLDQFLGTGINALEKPATSGLLDDLIAPKEEPSQPEEPEKKTLEEEPQDKPAPQETIELSQEDELQEKPTQQETVELSQEDELLEETEPEETVELQLDDAIEDKEEKTDEQRKNPLSSEQIKAVEEAVQKSPKAELPSPPADLKELIDLPSPQMPSPPEELKHEINVPEAKLPPPPDNFKEILQNAKPQTIAEASTPTEVVDSFQVKPPNTETASTEQKEKGLFDVSQEPASAQTQVSFEDALAESFSTSKTELEAIQQASTASKGNTSKQTMMYGLDVAEALQKEVEKRTKEEAKEEPIFPPTAPAPSTGTADFAAVDVPVRSTEVKSTRKRDNPLMQTALYGGEMDEMQKELIRQAAEHLGDLVNEEKKEPKKEKIAAQTQMYGAEDVAKAVRELTSSQPNATVADLNATQIEPEKDEKQGLKIQIDTSKQLDRSKLPMDSLFDDKSGQEAVQQVAAEAEAQKLRNNLEAQARQAEQNNQLVAAIKIYHQLQKMNPNETHYEKKLKELVAKHKKAQEQPSSPVKTAQPAQPAQPITRPTQPKAKSQKKKRKKKQGNTLNLILGIIVGILAITLITGLVWPGWLKKTKTPTAKPKKVAPLIPVGTRSVNPKKPSQKEKKETK